jgi:6-methylsalicylate decarboxylase
MAEPDPAEPQDPGTAPTPVVDVHQHLWPPELIAELRRRDSAPRLDGWTLQLSGEPDFQVDPADHDPVRRAALAAAEGTELSLVSLSSPLGIEHMPAAEAQPLLDAYHLGAARLGAPFGAWAAASVDQPQPEELGRLLAAGFHGLQLPATALADAAGYRRCAALLDTLVQFGRPLLIHPGPAAGPGPDQCADPGPGWWPAVVSYVAQMHAAWFAFRAFGRPAHPGLRVCFTMLAGLAPLHWERAAARGAGEHAGGRDPQVWLEVSSYGPSAIGAVAAVCGAGALIRGSDRPYATVPSYGLGAAAARLLDAANPAQLLGS